MKRTPLKRKTGLARTSALKPTTTLARTTGLARITELTRTAPKRKAHLSSSTRKRVKRRSFGRCICCPDQGREIHHVLAERDYPDLAKNAENLVFLCTTCHARHENAFRRIPREKLPACAIELAESVGAGWYIERFYA